MWIQRWAKALREPPGNPRPILAIFGILVLASSAESDPIFGLLFWCGIGLLIEWTLRVEKKHEKRGDGE
ncbi:MAG: hypothetical protein P3W96_011085 [Halomonas sp.]|nr:hypothetical protein [Halomonas sp.]MDM7482534.1 hypothetical protein [Halomonas sp.]